MLSNQFAEKFQKFSNLKNQLQGVYSADTLPREIKKDKFKICNTDVSSGEGKHWYCVLKLENNVLECFDSLGITREKKLFLANNFRQRYIKKIKFNVTQVQSSTSDTCGLFVLYFIVQRFHNKDENFTDLVNEIFVESHSQNEKVVLEFAKTHFL